MRGLLRRNNPGRDVVDQYGLPLPPLLDVEVVTG